MLKSKVRVLFFVTLIIFGILSYGLFSAGRMLNLKEAPVKSDAMVLLAGENLRAFYAADLFQQKFAEKILVSRSKPDKSLVLVRQLGIEMPDEIDINLKVLEKKGVLPAAIEIFGNESVSTVEEALALRNFLNTRPS